MDKNPNWGGKRNGSGRFPRNIKISPEASQELAILVKQRRLINPEITESQIINELIHTAWHDLDQEYIQSLRSRS